jgi:4-carboxymuconolactone decarboxylase
MSEDAALFEKGMPIRREVLVADYVGNAMDKADDFRMAFQRVTTRIVWCGETLARRSRGLVNLAMLTALNRAPAMKLHVKSALNNGVALQKIRAVLLHAAYCGIPAGLDAFKVAQDALLKEGAIPSAEGVA